MEIPLQDHLVQEEIILVLAHFPKYGVVSTKPHIGLLGDGRVKVPAFPILSTQLRKFSRVTVFPTEDVS